MAEIETSVLRIGSNDLILQDAEARTKINDMYITDTASGAIASFPDGADNVPVKSLTVDIEPVQSGSGDPSPDNVRPISGHTSAVVTRCGKNLLDPSIGLNWSIYWAFGSSGTGSNVPDGSLTLKKGTYTFSCNQNVTTLSVRTSETNEIARVNNASSVTFTLDENHVVKLGVSGTETFADFQLELGSTATAYEPYTADTYTIDLDGTRYGGSLDVGTGVLTVTDANIASYNGETLPSTWISDRDVYASGTTPTTGAQVVYKLATPTTVQLTANEISTLLGQNNIWNDCGNTEVEYRADTKLYIQKMLNA